MGALVGTTLFRCVVDWARDSTTSPAIITAKLIAPISGESPACQRYHCNPPPGPMVN
jgi:hypothetical protein